MIDSAPMPASIPLKRHISLHAILREQQAITTMSDNEANVNILQQMKEGLEKNLIFTVNYTLPDFLLSPLSSSSESHPVNAFKSL